MIENMNQTEEQRTENLDDLRLTVKEAAKHIQESPGVVRNWMRELKSHIPTIQGENGYHYFDQSALDKLVLIRKLNRDQNYSLKQIDYYFSNGETQIQTEPVHVVSNDIREDLKTIVDRLELQQQFNQALVTKLDEQQQYIKDSLIKRDQMLLESLKASQEARKAEVNNRKKGFLGRMFQLSE
jgi:DNA-binding transcriptional MerR regulator